MKDSEIKIGAYVRWRDEPRIGRIKDWVANVVWVVFSADGNLDTPKFMDYTGQNCHPTDLTEVSAKEREAAMEKKEEIRNEQ